jgi:hypothetical protein
LPPDPAFAVGSIHSHLIGEVMCAPAWLYVEEDSPSVSSSLSTSSKMEPPPLSPLTPLSGPTSPAFSSVASASSMPSSTGTRSNGSVVVGVNDLKAHVRELVERAQFELACAKYASALNTYREAFEKWQELLMYVLQHFELVICVVFHA